MTKPNQIAALPYRLGQDGKLSYVPSSLRPEDAKALTEANRLRAAREFVAAERALVGLLKRYPQEAFIWCCLGWVAREQGKAENALKLLGQAANLAPRDPLVANSLADLLYALGQLEAAEQAARVAVEVVPGYAEAHNTLGVVLDAQERPTEAERALHTALRIAPRSVQTMCSLASLLAARGAYKEAAELAERALQLDGSCAEAFHNRGVALEGLGRFAEAERALLAALERKPALADAHYALGLLQLRRGEFRFGWAHHEWRWDMGRRFPSPRRPFEAPAWDGLPLGDKTILVHAEQGVGDVIQFARYLPVLHERHPGAVIVFEADPRLVPLFRRAFGEFARIEPAVDLQAGNINGYDCHVPLMSLPHLLDATVENIPGAAGYLRAGGGRRGSGGKRVVGLSWYSANRKSGGKRSIPLETFAPLADLPDVEFVNLQYGDTTAEREQAARLGLHLREPDGAGPLQDLDAFADHVAACDLVVTIDNTTAHMAGALGVPCLLLLPTVAEWRWMEHPTATAWYRSITLLRKPEGGSWAEVVARAKALLAGGFDRAAETPAVRPARRHTAPGLFERPVLVLGMPRSGTSMTTGLLGLAGLWLGWTVPGDEFNPRGYFENVMLRDGWEKPLLASLGADPLGVHPLPDMAEAAKPVDGLPGKIRRLLWMQGYDERQVWGFKGAKMTLLWPQWHAHFPQTRWIIVRRNPDDIVRSCLRTPFMAQHSTEPSFWYAFIAEYEKRLDALKASGAAYWEVSTEDLAVGRFDALASVAEALELRWNQAAAREFVQPSYWHGKSIASKG